VELFLFRAVQLAYSLDDTEAAAVMRHLKISHPYGQAGNLPHQTAQDGVGYGQPIFGNQLLSMMGKVKTYTEQAHSDEERNSWHATLASAEQIIFLGFAFHRQNIDLLTPAAGGPISSAPAIIASSYEVSRSDEEIFEERVKLMLKYGSPTSPLHDYIVKFNNGTCSELIVNYGLQITN
jgi:hypothetical protein